VPVHARGTGLVQQDVRERVRQVARHRDEPVVRLGVDRDGERAERGDEAVQELVALRLGRGDRGQEPGRALEELRGRALRPASLGAADRVPADEAWLAGGRRTDAALRRADVGDGAAGPARVEDRPHLRGQRGHRCGDERELGTGERRSELGRRLDRAARRRDLEMGRVGIPAHDVLQPGPPGGETHGRADQAGADDREPHQCFSR
jgi:hypothetical protein